MASITYTIADEKLDAYKEAFIACNPVPTDSAGELLMTENEWIKEWGLRQFLKSYKQGKQILASRSVIFDEEIVE